MPAVVAAFTTTLCYRSAETLHPYLSELNITNPETLLEKYDYCAQCIDFKESQSQHNVSSGPIYEDTPFAEAPRLLECWSALEAFKRRWNEEMTIGDDGRCPCCRHGQQSMCTTHDDPREFFPTTEVRGDDGDKAENTTRKCLDLLLERLGQLIKATVRAGGRLTFPIPLLEELFKFVRCESEALEIYQRADGSVVSAVSLSFGLLLLLESFRSYRLFPDQESIPPQIQRPRALAPTTPPPSRGAELASDPDLLLGHNTPFTPPPSPSSVSKGANINTKPPPPANCRITSLRLAYDLKHGIE